MSSMLLFSFDLNWNEPYSSYTNITSRLETRFWKDKVCKVLYSQYAIKTSLLPITLFNELKSTTLFDKDDRYFIDSITLNRMWFLDNKAKLFIES